MRTHLTFTWYQHVTPLNENESKTCLHCFIVKKYWTVCSHNFSSSARNSYLRLLNNICCHQERLDFVRVICQNAFIRSEILSVFLVRWFLLICFWWNEQCAFSVRLSGFVNAKLEVKRCFGYLFGTIKQWDLIEQLIEAWSDWHMVSGSATNCHMTLDVSE